MLWATSGLVNPTLQWETCFIGQICAGTSKRPMCIPLWPITLRYTSKITVSWRTFIMMMWHRLIDSRVYIRLYVTIEQLLRVPASASVALSILRVWWDAYRMGRTKNQRTSKPSVIVVLCLQLDSDRSDNRWLLSYWHRSHAFYHDRYTSCLPSTRASSRFCHS